MKSVVTNARHDSEHLHTNMRAGGAQIVSLLHSLSAGKNAYGILPLCQTLCSVLRTQGNLQALRNSKGEETDLDKE